MSEEAKNLIVSLLNRNPSKRLGAGPDGAEEIKRHPFFVNIEWKTVREKKLSAPKLGESAQKVVESTFSEEQIKRIYEDLDEIQDEQYENRNVEGWSFVASVLNQNNAGNLQQ